MAIKHTSPAARLLRHSRLFSLPPPLPRPSTENNTPGWIQDSDTATLPYPTHASLQTTTSSLSRGDWGLKRPLPLKSTTNTSTPIFRIKAIDTIDHVTDYEPSVDHALALQKFQEMNIPIKMPVESGQFTQAPLADQNKSVFEHDLQSTEIPNRDLERDAKDQPIRWKFGGRWLAGMDRSGFEDYVEREIKQRRGEFRRFLRKAVIKARNQESKSIATDRGEEWSGPSDELTDEDFRKEISRLRQSRLDLWKLIWEFLDLPGSPPQAAETERGSSTFMKEGTGLDNAPPTTHRSSGLSYIRNASYVANHPILGPVSSQPPVLARSFESRESGSNLLLGIGGFIGNVKKDSAFRKDGSLRSKREDERMEFEEVGGPKKWVHPISATVDSRGRVHIDWSLAKEDAVAVWENKDIQVR